MALVAVCAVGFTVFRHAGLPATVYVFALLFVALTGWPKEAENQARFIACLCASQIALLLGLWCAVSAYYTLSEVISFGYWLVMIVHVVPATLCARRYYHAGIVTAMTLFPEQVVLSRRLSRLRQEVLSIVAFANERKSSTGHFPSDLSGYRFQAWDLTDHLRYRPQTDAFRVDYWVVQPGISHWYSTETGWGYYPD
jgi:hypothetical protein